MAANVDPKMITVQQVYRAISSERSRSEALENISSRLERIPNMSENNERGLTG